jgi:hypothetical protein
MIITNMSEIQCAVSELFSKGLESNETALGYHGTSWEAIEELLRTGVLPASSSKNVSDDAHPAGRVYFYPLKEALPKHPLACTFLEMHAIMKNAGWYARSTARVHAFVRALDLDLNDRSLNQLAGSLFLFDTTLPSKISALIKLFSKNFAMKLYESLKNFDKTDLEIQDALRLANEREGIVLSIRRNVVKAFEIADGDKNEGDVCLLCPNGVPIKHISGIEPLGQYEYDQLDRLSE